MPVASAKAFGGTGPVRGSSLHATHNGAGLGQPFPAFPVTHSTDLSDAFVSVDGTNISLHYDFGSQRSVDCLRIWNYHTDEHGHAGSSPGLHKIRLFAANEPAAYDDPAHSDWTLIMPVTVARAPDGGATTAFGESHDFPDVVTARYIRIQVDTNYGAAATGVSEVQFIHSRDR